MGDEIGATEEATPSSWTPAERVPHETAEREGPISLEIVAQFMGPPHQRFVPNEEQRAAFDRSIARAAGGVPARTTAELRARFGDAK